LTVGTPSRGEPAVRRRRPKRGPFFDEFADEFVRVLKWPRKIVEQPRADAWFAWRKWMCSSGSLT